jgi:hypothetical protein
VILKVRLELESYRSSYMVFESIPMSLSPTQTSFELLFSWKTYCPGDDFSVFCSNESFS